MVKKLAIIICLFEFISSGVKAQDPTFSQFNFNPLYFNPAFTGIDPGLRINSTYRSLWSSIPSSFRTYSIAADMQSLCLSSGQGIVVMKDIEGEGGMKTTKAGAFYSYRIVLLPEDAILQAGVEMDYVQKSIDWDKLVFSDQIDSLTPVIIPTQNVPPNQEFSSYPDFHFGLVGRFNLHKKRSREFSTLTLGFAIHHLTTPDESIFGVSSPLPQKLTVNGSWAFNIDNRSKHRNYPMLFGPTFLWEMQDVTRSYAPNFNRPFKTFNIGLAFSSLPLYASVYYRNMTPLFLDLEHSDAMILQLAFNGKATDEFNYRIGYSYDVTLSELKDVSGGSHEISIQITFPNANLICKAVGRADDIYTNKRKQDCYSF